MSLITKKKRQIEYWITVIALLLFFITTIIGVFVEFEYNTDTLEKGMKYTLRFINNTQTTSFIALITSAIPIIIDFYKYRKQVNVIWET